MQYFKFIVISIAFLVAVNFGHSSNYNSLSIISKNKDSLKLVHTIGIGAKIVGSQGSSEDDFSVVAKYNLPAIDLFYALNFVKRKKKFIALNAIVSYYSGNVDWAESWHGQTTRRYYGNFQFIRGGLGIARFRKISKDGSLRFGLGCDVSATLYSNRVDFYSWQLVSTTSGYYYDVVNSTKSLGQVLKPIRVFWKAELVKQIKVGDKLNAMVGLKLTLSRHDFDFRFGFNPMVCGGLNFGICF